MHIQNVLMLALIAAPFLSTTAMAGAGINGGACLPTLAAAVAAASDGDKIYVSPGTYTIANQVLDKDLEILSSTVTCSAATTKQVTFVGNNSDPMFTVDAHHVFFRDVTLKDNTLSSGNGPILRVHSTGGIATLDNTVIADGSTGDMGGCVDVYSDGVLALTNNSEIDHCDASGGGGGVRVDTSTLYVWNGSKIRRNSALSSDGGGVHARASTIWVQGEISDNTAENGGGIYIPNAINTATTSLGGELIGNSATDNGGGIYIGDINHTASFYSNALIEDNSADNGGGLYMSYGTLTVSDEVEFNDNDATLHGGGAYLATGATLSATGDDIGDVRFDSNTAGLNGGGLYLLGDNASLEFATFAYNDANLFGGGLYISDSGFSFSDTVELDNVRVLNNSAASGGGLYVDGIDVKMRSNFSACDPTTLAKGRFCSELRFNDADAGAGGGIRVTDGGTVDIMTTGIRGNTAYSGGAAANVDGSSSELGLQNTLVLAHAAGQGAVRAESGSTLDVAASTFATNGIPVEFIAGTSGTFHRNIVWNNSGTLAVSAVSGNCNQLEDAGTAPTGSKNVVGNPLFDVTNTRSAYKLQSASTAIDACGAGPNTDLDGTSRAQGAKFDRGAFEMP